MLRRSFRHNRSLWLAGCIGIIAGGVLDLAAVAVPTSSDAGRAFKNVAKEYARPVSLITWPPPVLERGESGRSLPDSVAARASFEQLRTSSMERETGAVPSPQSTLVDDFAGMSDTGFIPPDTMGAVGPNHVMSVINGGAQVLTRTGFPAMAQQTLQSFWSPLGTAPGSPASALTDPRILYDQYSDRWVTIVLGNPDNADGTNNAWVLIAISQTSDPTMGWNFYGVRANVSPIHATDWADFPGLGVDPNNVIVTSNIFTVGASPSFVHSDIWVFEKAKLISGGSGVNGALIQGFDFALFHDPCGTGNFTFQPTHTYDQTPATGINYILDQGWLDVATRMRRSVAVKPITGVGSGAAIGCGADGFSDFFEVQQYNFSILGAPQSNCTQTVIAGGDTRLQDAVVRNGKIWFTHTVGAGSGITDSAPPSRAEVAWYQVDPSAAASFPGGLPVQQGHVSNFLRAYFFPSIAVNASDCAALGFSGSDSNSFVSAYFTSRAASDPPGTMQPVTLLKAGEGHYFKTFGGARNRWGDYSATVVDPVDDDTFWTLQEYAKVPNGSPLACAANSGVWGTWWGSFTCGVALPDPPVAGPNTYDRALEITMPASSAGLQTAYRVTLTSLYHPADPQPTNQLDYSGEEGTVRYLNLLRDGSGNVVTDCLSSSAFGTTYPCMSVGCTPEFADWGTLFGGVTAYALGNAIIPDSTYTVAQLAASCAGNEAACTDASAEVAFTTARYGDSQPDGTVNVGDVVNTVDVLKQASTALLEYHVYVRDLDPSPQSSSVNVQDIVSHVDALKLKAYQLSVSTCP